MIEEIRDARRPNWDLFRSGDWWSEKICASFLWGLGLWWTSTNLYGRLLGLDQECDQRLDGLISNMKTPWFLFCVRKDWALYKECMEKSAKDVIRNKSFEYRGCLQGQPLGKQFRFPQKELNFSQTFWAFATPPRWNIDKKTNTISKFAARRHNRFGDMA